MSMDLEDAYDKLYRYCYHRLGSREAAEKTARSLAARFSLTEEPRSKFRRAMDLAGG